MRQDSRIGRAKPAYKVSGWMPRIKIKTALVVLQGV